MGIELNYIDMFYKEENDKWIKGYRVAIPDVGVFTEANKDDIPEPWFWSDNPPQEYLDWLDEQEKYEEE